MIYSMDSAMTAKASTSMTRRSGKISVSQPRLMPSIAAVEEMAV